MTACRFETAHAEVLQGRDMALQWRVVDMVLLGGLRTQHLAKRKVLRKEHIGIE